MKAKHSRLYITLVVFASAVIGMVLLIALDQAFPDTWFARPAGLIVACVVGALLLRRGARGP